MGRLIDVDRLKDILEYGILCNVPNDAINTNEEKWNDWVQEVVDNAPTVEAIPKADYESKLKTDMVTMLEELKKEIIELPFPQREPEYMQGYSYCQINILDYVIQEKINELKENTDGSN